MSQSSRKTSIGTALIKRKKKEKSKKSESVPSVVVHHNQTIKNNAPKDIKEKENEEENYEVIVIPANHSTSLKWCLFNVENEQDTQGYPGTPTDFILKHFLAEFKNLTNAKIQEILQSNLEEPLSLTEVFRPNKQNAIISNFHQVVTSLAVVAQHKCLSFIINAIKEWRNYQFSISAKDKQTKNLTKDQLATLEEKHSLIVEYIFVTTVLSLLETWTTTNSLSDKESDALELIALDYFKSRTERTSAIPEKENNRKKVTYHFSLLVRVLAKHNFSRVINRFYESIFSLISSSKSKPHAIAKLEGMHYIQLTIQTQREVDDTLNFLTIFCEALKSKTGKANKDTRLALSLMLVSTLRSLVTQQRAPDVDYLEFNRLLTGLFDYYSSSVERKRSISNFRIQTVYPFLTALLAAVDEEFFLVNWIELIDSVKKFLKERNHRIIAINTICLLVEAYCTKFSQKDQQYRERMDFITEILFYKKHRAGEVYFAQGESTATLEIIANIIVIIAQRDLDYAIRKIIFELIRSEIKKLPLEGQPEKVFIAFRAIGRIFEISQSSTTPNPSSSSDQLTTLNSSLSSQFLNSLEEFMPSICDFTKQLILALDTVFREWLLSNQTKTINELFQKERVPALALYILRLCVSFIPPAIPSGMSDSDLVNILARYLVHIDTDLREKAYNRLYVLMKTSPRHRPIIITGVGKFILTLPDRKVDIIIMVLNKLKEFVNFWVDLPPSLNIVSEKEKISEKEYEIHKDLSVSVNFLSEFEAIALVYLCNPNSTIRSIGLQLLFSIRLLAAHSSNQITTHTRVMDIIDESGDIIVKKLMEDIRFCAEYPCALDTDHTSIIKIVSNENDKHQPCWTYCLAEIIKNTHILCSQVTRCAWQIISARVDDLTNSSTENFDFLTHLWRNYITFACIIVGTENEGSIGAKELYNLLAAGLKNEHQREAVVMAFQRANLDTLDSLFEVLKPYEQEYSSSKKTKKFRERLRNDISNILGQITENIPEGLLIENDKVRHGYMSHVQESMIYITSCEVIDESGLYLYNIFSLVHNVAADLEIVSKEEFYFDRALRKKLFLFFVWWTSQSFDEVTQREISNELFHKKNIHRRQNIPQNEGGMALLIQHKACLAAAALLCFPLHKEEPITNEDSTLSWIRRMLKHDQPELKEAALKGLQGFLRSNAESPEVFKIAVSNCYSQEKDVRDGYFLAIVDLFRNESELTGFHYGTLINLILYKMADEEINIRRNSVQLLQIIGALREDVEEFWTDNYCPPSIDSSLFELHQHDQLEVSTRLAKDYKQCAIEVFSEMVYRLESVSPLDQKLMLSYIIPWIRRIKLEKLHPTILTVFLQKMFWITLKFDGNTHYSYVFNLWQTLAKRDDNIVLITDFSLSMGSAKKNPEFVNLAKRVAVYLCNTNPSVTLDAFVNELSTISKSRRRKKRVNFPTIIKYDIHSLNINLDPYATIKTIHRDINIDNLNSNSGSNENNNNNTNINNINNNTNNVNIQSQSNPASAHENEENFPQAEPTDIILSTSPSNNNILVSTSSNNINMMSNANSVNNTSGGNIASLAVPVITQLDLSPRGGGATTKINPSQIPAPSQGQQPPLSPHNNTPPRPLTSSYNLSLNDLMPEVSNFISPARGHLALVLIAEISFEKIATQVVNHLPVLLQQIFLGLDNINRLVYDHCRILLQNLIEMLVLDRERRKDNYLESEAYLEGQQLVEFLKSRERKPFWMRENIAESHSKNRSSEYLKTLVNQVAKVLSGKYTKLIESWGAEAHAWAINCPDDHWRCRSLQIFRTLNPTPTSEIVVDLIHLLLKEVKELEYIARSPCGIVLEILYTLQKMVDNMDSNRIVLFNQIFWASVALLRTDFEVIYNQAVILLSIIIDHVDFNEKAVQSVLLASKPQNWKPDFLGIQPLLLKGLLSEQTYLNAIEVLSNIAPLPLDEIFHNDPSRMVTNMLGLLPWMCSNLGNSSEIAKCIKKAELIAVACKRTRLNQLFEVFSKLHTYTNVSLFLDDWSEAFATAFFPQFGVFTFTFLLELLQQGPSKYHRSILWLLHSLTKNFDINQKEINSKIPSWFGLVVQFINADLWREALQVLSASVQQCPLTSSQIDISNLPSYRANQKITYFKNVFGEGTVSVVNAISKILSKSDNVRSTENIISPRAFSKFFSSDDMNIRMSEDEEDAQNSSMISKTTSTPNKEEDESDYGGSMVELESSEGEGSVFEKSDDSEDEKFYSRGTTSRFPNNPIQTPDLFPSHQPGFGGGFGGGFPSFKGFNDIFDDIQKENEFK